ncbi:hypothetical protein E2C01_100600 [Portunus trituberculatus]|uniref:Uncharacterized protein n=1 Tax=Portunus trituberculatus TaxID=210409 RepID=A0A5B7KIC9_PORTR|nr:hypothetical protein [Portunus trituberculatus]
MSKKKEKKEEEECSGVKDIQVSIVHEKNVISLSPLPGQSCVMPSVACEVPRVCDQEVAIKIIPLGRSSGHEGGGECGTRQGELHKGEVSEVAGWRRI